MPDAQELPSESVRLERRRLESQQLAALGQLAGGVAHDFNNLLMIILGNAEIGLMTAPADSPSRSHFEQIETAALRAAELGRQLMAYAGQTQLTLRPLAISSWFQDLVEGLPCSAGPAVALHCEIADGPPPVEADAEQLSQAVVNLVTNAIEALPSQGGAITVRCGTFVADRCYLDQVLPSADLAEGRYVFLEVADNGCGMAPETAARIFNPFFTTKSKRHGLGLSALLGIVRGHGGGVRVESAIGQGTTVRILLPPAAEVNADLRAMLMP